MAKSNKLIDKKFIKNYVKNSLDYLEKNDVLAIYKKYNIGPIKSNLTKYEMVNALEKSKIDFWEVYQDYKHRAFGISAYELYNLLNIDKKIKDKMLKSNLLSVAYTRAVKTQFKKWIDAPYFLLEDLYKIDKDFFEEWKSKIKPATPKQLAALEKAREAAIKNKTCISCGVVMGTKKDLTDGKCYECIHADKIRETYKDIIKNKDQYVILDTETTGLSNDDQIVEIAIIDLDGKELLNTRVYTEAPISPEASYVNGIKNSDLVGKPTIKELNSSIQNILKGKTVLIYNDDFDVRMLYQSGYEGEIESWCMMYLYMDYINSDRWIGLQRAMDYEGVNIHQDHSAIGDCRCVLELIKAIAFINQ
ncbi:3'-5' exonuclease [Clostridium celatum]|uniref:3'-5' exonuclease n=1 Tax=Clostridium celatum TaxID=36834 RepID=UPI00319E8313